MKINYDLKMEEELKNISLNPKPKILLHACCAPCSSTVIETLKNYFDITIFYFNPNTTEEEEYYKRLDELKEYIFKRGYNIEVLEGRYNPREDFFEKIKGLENIPERGERCKVCYNIRMEETAKVGKEKNYDFFSTVLSISPLKNSDWINEIGEELEKKYDIKYLHGDFKKKGRYQESIKISKDYNLYRQDYCGCVFSKVEMENYRREKEKREKINE